MKQKQSKPVKKSRIVMIIICALVLLVGGGVTYAIYKQSKPDMVKSTSKSKTAQNDYSEGDDRQTDVGTGGSQGGATDNNGQQPSNPSGSDATISSDSGVITVKGIAANSLLTNGASLYGTSTAQGTVNFRVIDEDVGVLAQGTLQIVNGSFSGKLAFTPRANTGRLDVYTTSSLGDEENNIEIPVRFK
jgi:hypothetical protein